LKVDKREMVYQAIRHNEPVHLPYHIDVLPPVAEKLKEHFATDDIDAAMGNFMRWLRMEKEWQELPGGPCASAIRDASMGGRARDEFGVIWQQTSVNRGYVAERPLKEPSLIGYELPEFDYGKKLAHFAREIERGKGHFLVAWVGDLWERAHFLRGLDNLLADLLLHPAFVHELLERLEKVILRNMDAIGRFPVNGFFLSDDYGLQKSLMMRPETWREFIKPHLIEVGLDVLHPIQPEAMNIALLKRKFGSDLTLYGGLGTQVFLVRQSPAGVRQEVKRLAQLMGQGGGYILGPGISIQHDVPFPNLLALIEQAGSLAG